MGVFDFITSTTELAKHYTPDLTPVVNACKTSLGYGSAAFWTIDNAVRVNALQELNRYMPDEEGRARIGSFATKFAKNAALYGFQEGYKLIPGGKAVAKIASRTANELKNENHQALETKAPKGNNGGTVTRSQNEPFKDSIRSQKPEDVLRVFMIKEFIGTRLLDDLIVPGAKRSK